MAIPDPASFTPIPFIKDGLAIVHCDPHVNGEPWPYAPRVILKALIQRAADAGFEPWVGAEVEYFLLHRNADGSLSHRRHRRHRRAALLRRPRRHPDVRPPHRDLGGDEHARLVELRQRPRGRQRPVRAELPVRRRADHRRPGRHAALPAVDDRRRARHGRHLHAQAVRRPHRQRPAPAPVADQRRHTRLPRRRRRPRPRACPRPRTRSSAGSSNTPARCRPWSRQRSTPTSEPARPPRRRARRGRRSTPTYGGNDRTHYIRVPDDQRIELRGGDGSANPYLAIAAALGAGIDGIKRSADPGAVGGARTAGRCRRRCCTRSTSSRPTRWSPVCSTPRATVWRGYFAERQARRVLRLPQRRSRRGRSTTT